MTKREMPRKTSLTELTANE